MNLIFAFVLCLGGALATVTIQSPQSLIDQFEQNSIKAVYANFGFIPYGHTIIGSIAYDKNNMDLCNPYNQTLDNGDKQSGMSKFIIARRGKCMFTEKVRHMEDAGAAVGILVDNTNENVESLIMINDGNGYGIRTPSIMIGKSDGEKILKFLDTANQTEID